LFRRVVAFVPLRAVLGGRSERVRELCGGTKGGMDVWQVEPRSWHLDITIY